MNHLSDKYKKNQPSGHAVYTSEGWIEISDDRIEDNYKSPQLARWFVFMFLAIIVILSYLAIPSILRMIIGG